MFISFCIVLFFVTLRNASTSSVVITSPTALTSSLTCQPYVDFGQASTTTQNKCNIYGPLSLGGYSNGGGSDNNGFTLNACGYSLTSPLLCLLNSLIDLVFVSGRGLGLITSGLLSGLTCNTFIQVDVTRYQIYSNSAIWPIANYWAYDQLFVVSGLDSHGALIRADFTIYGSNTQGALGVPLCNGKSQLSGETFNMSASCISTPSYTAYQYLSVQAGIGGSCPANCQSMYMKRVVPAGQPPSNN